MANYTFYKPDPEDMVRLLEQEGDSPTGLLLSLAWQAGLLRGEIRTLRWRQVDFPAAMLRLPDRNVPIPSELCSKLARRKAETGAGPEDYVVADKRGNPYSEPYLSRLARQALDQAGQTRVRLIDLRHDYIVRLLEQEDWQCVCQKAGIGPVSVRAHFLPHTQTPALQQEQKTREAPPLDRKKLEAVIAAQGFTPEGTLLRLSYRMGLPLSQMQSLTWDQVDLDRGVLLLPGGSQPIPPDVRTYLAGLKERRRGTSSHVIVSQRGGRPMDMAYLSKRARAALIAGGIRDITLSHLREDYHHHAQVEVPVLALAREQGSVTRQDVRRLLEVSPMQAYTRLSRMTAQGSLVRVGNRYFPPEAVADPCRHEEMILDYLRREGSAVRQDFARLLHILPRQVYPILRRLIAEGKVRFQDGRYYPAEEETSNDDTV